MSPKKSSHHLLKLWKSQSALHEMENLIVGSHALYNVVKAYENAVNAISTFVDTNPPTNNITK